MPHARALDRLSLTRSLRKRSTDCQLTHRQEANLRCGRTALIGTLTLDLLGGAARSSTVTGSLFSKMDLSPLGMRVFREARTEVLSLTSPATGATPLKS